MSRTETAVFRLLTVINTKNVRTSHAEGDGTMTTVPSLVGMPASTPTIRLDNENGGSR